MHVVMFHLYVDYSQTVTIRLKTVEQAIYIYSDMWQIHTNT